MFLLRAWQSLWGEVSDLPWQEAGNRKQGGQQGGVLIPSPCELRGPGEAKVSETANPSPSISLARMGKECLKHERVLQARATQSALTLPPLTHREGAGRAGPAVSQ